MPTFCRHNRLLQHCPICAREQHVDLAPVISSSAPRSELSEGTRLPRTAPGESRRSVGGGRKSGGGAALQVRRLQRAADDGYRSPVASGLRSSIEAARLAEEMAFAAGRLRALSERPPGLYAEVARPGDLEERAWLAFLIAYLCPLDEEDPFTAIRQARTSWRAAESPDVGEVRTGPRSARDIERPMRTVEADQTWARRSGSQAAAYAGDPGWSAERRFTRVFERLALPGLHRDARFDLLVTLGCLGAFDLRPGQLMLGGSDEVTVGAKRVFGIGDSLVLEGRAAAFARTCGVPLAALDLGLYNWQRGERAHMGLMPGTAPDQDALASVRTGLGL